MRTDLAEGVSLLEGDYCRFKMVYLSIYHHDTLVYTCIKRIGQVSYNYCIIIYRMKNNLRFVLHV